MLSKAIKKIKIKIIFAVFFKLKLKKKNFKNRKKMSKKKELNDNALKEEKNTSKYLHANIKKKVRKLLK